MRIYLGKQTMKTTHQKNIKFRLYFFDDFWYKLLHKRTRNELQSFISYLCCVVNLKVSLPRGKTITFMKMFDTRLKDIVTWSWQSPRASKKMKTKKNKMAVEESQFQRKYLFIYFRFCFGGRASGGICKYRKRQSSEDVRFSFWERVMLKEKVM